jgi:hypothetical protein
MKNYRRRVVPREDITASDRSFPASLEDAAVNRQDATADRESVTVDRESVTVNQEGFAEGL